MLLEKYMTHTWDWNMNDTHQVLIYEDDINLIGDIYENNRKKRRCFIKS
jgi:hypothetical protein